MCTWVGKSREKLHGMPDLTRTRSADLISRIGRKMHTEKHTSVGKCGKHANVCHQMITLCFFSGDDSDDDDTNVNKFGYLYMQTAEKFLL